MRVELEHGGSPLVGEVTAPPDKSISHRAVMFSSLAKGVSKVTNPLMAEDTISTMNAFRSLGVDIKESPDGLIIAGQGIGGLIESDAPIDCGNSGTTMRLISGVLSGAPIKSMLLGDDSLSKRPMKRVMTPLREMGADITASRQDNYPPLIINGGGLHSITYKMPVASAQVKSAVMLAALFAHGQTEIIESIKSRDHSERMLPSYGAKVTVDGLSVMVTGGAEMHAVDMNVPGDFSSAAFFMVAATLVKGSELLIKNIGLNPTRTGLLNVLRRMGANITVQDERLASGEPVGDILCRYAALKGVDVLPEEVPSLIDEFPVLCVAASLAEGVTTIRGAEELRVKESDRITAVAAPLRAMGVTIEEYDDGMKITGRQSLDGAEINSLGDHRVAMSFAVASLVSDGMVAIENAEAVNISYPGFFDELKRVTDG